MDILDKADLVIVGAGFYGATIAERAANEHGLKVVIVERRGHIGGNAYSETDPDTGIEVHRYGPHIFHTPNDAVWSYLNRFTSFTDYTHRPFSVFRGQAYSLPINLATICQFFRRQLSPDEARALIAGQAAEMAGREPDNLEEKAISLIGRPLYEAFIRGYTKKQWQTDPRDLPASIISRLPVRYTFDNRYFSDPHQGMPLSGYTAIFDRMLDHENIHVLLDCDWFELRDSIPRAVPTVYTGPIDAYFGFSEGRLGWRTCDFSRSVVATGDYQGTAMMNYADEETAHTRIVEYRHFHPERDYPVDRSVIVHEYARSAGAGDEPYYPIDTLADKALYLRYRALADREPNVHFGGRLGTYRYLDMHQAIGAALKEWERLRTSEFAHGRKAPA
ncbi:UDP-galactopyranose mutase [Hoeflea marina]|uniref:UDP-galactopyranose mutase n=1 Tax=Hoeflea marina TaxID=274592 RepID=A0A317PED9_9HYPH|nr:UDP-galactopyranose mutase [Hoeflea marina]PWV95753.1 UDP-galactopyranose mutase [Hoeflea marina]